MFIHLVRLDCSQLSPVERQETERDLRSLVDVPVVEALDVIRDSLEPDVTVLVVRLRASTDLPAYRTHPRHLAVAERLGARGLSGVKVDVDLSGSTVRPIRAAPQQPAYRRSPHETGHVLE